MNQQGANAIKWEVGKAYLTRYGEKAVAEFEHPGNRWLQMKTEKNDGTYLMYRVCMMGGRSESAVLNGRDAISIYDIVGPWEDGKADADLYDDIPVPAKSERTVKARYVPSDYAGAHLRDVQTPDNRRPRVDLRTDAQIAHDRAVLRLRQHKLARWGMAESVDWEGE